MRDRVLVTLFVAIVRGGGLEAPADLVAHGATVAGGVAVDPIVGGCGYADTELRRGARRIEPRPARFIAWAIVRHKRRRRPRGAYSARRRCPGRVAGPVGRSSRWRPPATAGGHCGTARRPRT